MTVDLEQLARNEGPQVEWKEGVADWRNVAKAIVAFTNDYHNLGGGYVVCGARETRDEHGFPAMSRPGLTAGRIKELRGKILNALRDHADPAIVPLVEELPSDNDERRVLVFVAPQTGHAHTWRDKADGSGKYWIRIDSQTIEARNGLLMQLLTRRGALPPWDQRPRPDATVQDLDLLKLREALVRMRVYDENRGVDPYLQPDQRIHALAPALTVAEPLTGELRPRNFALLLFGRDPQRWAPGAHVVVSVYQGTDRSEKTAERYSLTGSLIEQADELLRRLEVLSPDVFDKGGPRENLSRFPARALKEVAINALAHRDYESSQPVRVTVFTDRVEVHSPGSLPPEVPREAFLAGRATAHWRNQGLSWFFNRLDLAQSEGQGIPTIIRVMQEAGYPDPEIDASEHHLQVRLRAHPTVDRVSDFAALDRHLAMGRREEFLTSLSAVAEDQPRGPATWQVLLDGLETFRTDARLARLFHELATDNPDVALPSDLVARALLQFPDERFEGEDDYHAASASVVAWGRAAAEGPLDPQSGRDLAVALCSRGEWDSAVAALRGTSPEEMDWRSRGVRAVALGEVYKRLIRTLHETSSRRLKQQVQAAATTMFDEALEDFEAAIRDAPEEQRAKLVVAREELTSPSDDSST